MHVRSSARPALFLALLIASHTARADHVVVRRANISLEIPGGIEPGSRDPLRARVPSHPLLTLEIVPVASHGGAAFLAVGPMMQALGRTLMRNPYIRILPHPFTQDGMQGQRFEGTATATGNTPLAFIAYGFATGAHTAVLIVIHGEPAAFAQSYDAITPIVTSIARLH